MTLLFLDSLLNSQVKVGIIAHSLDESGRLIGCLPGELGCIAPWKPGRITPLPVEPKVKAFLGNGDSVTI